MAIPPDPRDPAVSLTARDRLAPPETRDSVALARSDAERERRQYVLDVGQRSPRMGLQALLDLHPDAIPVLDKFLALCDEHGPATMAKVFVRLLAEGRR